MSPLRGGVTEASACFPRVSGDEPAVKTQDAAKLAFSPRERG